MPQRGRRKTKSITTRGRRAARKVGRKVHKTDDAEDDLTVAALNSDDKKKSSYNISQDSFFNLASSDEDNPDHGNDDFVESKIDDEVSLKHETRSTKGKEIAFQDSSKKADSLDTSSKIKSWLTLSDSSDSSDFLSVSVSNCTPKEVSVPSSSKQAATKETKTFDLSFLDTDSDDSDNLPDLSCPKSLVVNSKPNSLHENTTYASKNNENRYVEQSSNKSECSYSESLESNSPKHQLDGDVKGSSTSKYELEELINKNLTSNCQLDKDTNEISSPKPKRIRRPRSKNVKAEVQCNIRKKKISKYNHSPNKYVDIDIENQGKNKLAHYTNKGSKIPMSKYQLDEDPNESATSEYQSDGDSIEVSFLNVNSKTNNDIYSPKPKRIKGEPRSKKSKVEVEFSLSENTKSLNDSTESVESQQISPTTERKKRGRPRKNTISPIKKLIPLNLDSQKKVSPIKDLLILEQKQNDKISTITNEVENNLYIPGKSLMLKFRFKNFKKEITWFECILCNGNLDGNSNRYTLDEVVAHSQQVEHIANLVVKMYPHLLSQFSLKDLDDDLEKVIQKIKALEVNKNDDFVFASPVSKKKKIKYIMSRISNKDTCESSVLSIGSVLKKKKSLINDSIINEKENDGKTALINIEKENKGKTTTKIGKQNKGKTELINNKEQNSSSHVLGLPVKEADEYSQLDLSNKLIESCNTLLKMGSSSEETNMSSTNSEARLLEISCPYKRKRDKEDFLKSPKKRKNVSFDNGKKFTEKASCSGIKKAKDENVTSDKDKKFKKNVSHCGRKSGEDEDTPASDVCMKQSSFLDTNLEKNELSLNDSLSYCQDSSNLNKNKDDSKGSEKNKDNSKDLKKEKDDFKDLKKNKDDSKDLKKEKDDFKDLKKNKDDSKDSNKMKNDDQMLDLNDIVDEIRKRKLPQKIVVVADERDENLKLETLPDKVSLICNKGLSLESTYTVIEDDYDGSDTLYLILIGIHSVITWKPDLQCTKRNCGMPLQLLQPYKKITTQSLTMKVQELHIKVLKNLKNANIIFSHLNPVMMRKVNNERMKQHIATGNCNHKFHWSVQQRKPPSINLLNLIDYYNQWILNYCKSFQLPWTLNSIISAKPASELQLSLSSDGWLLNENAFRSRNESFLQFSLLILEAGENDDIQDSNQLTDNYIIYQKEEISSETYVYVVPSDSNDTIPVNIEMQQDEHHHHQDDNGAINTSSIQENENDTNQLVTFHLPESSDIIDQSTLLVCQTNQADKKSNGSTNFDSIEANENSILTNEVDNVSCKSQIERENIERLEHDSEKVLNDSEEVIASCSLEHEVSTTNELNSKAEKQFKNSEEVTAISLLQEEVLKIAELNTDDKKQFKELEEKTNNYMSEDAILVVNDLSTEIDTELNGSEKTTANFLLQNEILKLEKLNNEAEKQIKQPNEETVICMLESDVLIVKDLNTEVHTQLKHSEKTTDNILLQEEILIIEELNTEAKKQIKHQPEEETSNCMLEDDVLIVKDLKVEKKKQWKKPIDNPVKNDDQISLNAYIKDEYIADSSIKMINEKSPNINDEKINTSFTFEKESSFDDLNYLENEFKTSNLDLKCISNEEIEQILGDSNDMFKRSNDEPLTATLEDTCESIFDNFESILKYKNYKQIVVFVSEKYKGLLNSVSDSDISFNCFFNSRLDLISTHIYSNLHVIEKSTLCIVFFDIFTLSITKDYELCSMCKNPVPAVNFPFNNLKKKKDLFNTFTNNISLLYNQLCEDLSKTSNVIFYPLLPILTLPLQAECHDEYHKMSIDAISTVIVNPNMLASFKEFYNEVALKMYELSFLSPSLMMFENVVITQYFTNLVQVVGKEKTNVKLDLTKFLYLIEKIVDIEKGNIKCEDLSCPKQLMLQTCSKPLNYSQIVFVGGTLRNYGLSCPLSKVSFIDLKLNYLCDEEVNSFIEKANSFQNALFVIFYDFMDILVKLLFEQSVSCSQYGCDQQFHMYEMIKVLPKNISKNIHFKKLNRLQNLINVFIEKSQQNYNSVIVVPTKTCIFLNIDSLTVHHHDLHYVNKHYSEVLQTKGSYDEMNVSLKFLNKVVKMFISNVMKMQSISFESLNDFEVCHMYASLSYMKLQSPVLEIKWKELIDKLVQFFIPNTDQTDENLNVTENIDTLSTSGIASDDKLADEVFENFKAKTLTSYSFTPDINRSIAKTKSKFVFPTTPKPGTSLNTTTENMDVDNIESLLSQSKALLSNTSKLTSCQDEKVLIQSLPENVSNNVIMGFLDVCGEVKTFERSFDELFGYAIFKNKAGAANCIRHLNKLSLYKSTLEVKSSNPNFLMDPKNDGEKDEKIKLCISKLAKEHQVSDTQSLGFESDMSIEDSMQSVEKLVDVSMNSTKKAFDVSSIGTLKDLMNKNKKNVYTRVRISNYSSIVTAKFFEEIAMKLEGKYSKGKTDDFIISLPNQKFAIYLSKHLNKRRIIDCKLRAGILDIVKVDTNLDHNKITEAYVMDCINDLVKKYENIFISNAQIVIEDQLDLLLVKTTPCSKEICKSIDTCKYYHSAKDRRRYPVTYKSVKCIDNDFKNEKICTLKDTCDYCHNDVEYYYHPRRLENTLCQEWYGSNLCPASLIKNSFCMKSHPESAQVLFFSVWEDLFVIGLENSLNFLVGAIKNYHLAKPKDGSLKIVLFTTKDMTRTFQQIVQKKAETRHVQVGISESFDENCQVFICTFEEFKLAYEQNSKKVFSEIGCLIVDNVTSLLEQNNYPIIKNVIDDIYKAVPRPSKLNKVVISEHVDTIAKKDISDLLRCELIVPYNNKICRDYKDRQKSEDKFSIKHKRRRHRKHHWRSKHESRATESKERRQKSRSKSKDHIVNFPAKSRPHKYKSLSPHNNTSASDEDPSSNPEDRIYDNPSTSSASNTNNVALMPKFSIPERMCDLPLSAEKKEQIITYKMELDTKFNCYITTPESHSFYVLKRKHFFSKFKNKCGSVDNGKLLNIMWEEHWKNEINKIKEKEWTRYITSMEEKMKSSQSATKEKFNFQHVLQALQDECNRKSFGYLNTHVENLLQRAKSVELFSEEFHEIFSNPDVLVMLELAVDELEDLLQASTGDLNVTYKKSLEKGKQLLYFLNKVVSPTLPTISIDMAALRRGINIWKEKAQGMKFVRDILYCKGFTNVSDSLVVEYYCKANVND